MNIKAEYFIKNYFLNYSFRNNDSYEIKSVAEDAQCYSFRFRLGVRAINISISKTKKFDPFQDYKVINTSNDNRFSVISHYECGRGSPGKPLFRFGDGSTAVGYISQSREGALDVYVLIDIVDEVFYHLTAVEEYKEECRKKNGGSSYFNNGKAVINEPLVDVCYAFFSDILNSICKLHCIDIQAQRRLKSFNVSLTHDVDAIRKNNISTARYVSLLSTNYIKRPNLKTLASIYQYLTYRTNFNYIQDIASLEKGYGLRSTFLFYSKSESDFLYKKALSRLIDPVYDISNDDTFGNIFGSLRKEGFEIGLHSSYFAANDASILRKEFNLLEKCAGAPVSSNRSHFLKFSVGNTPVLLEKTGVKIDGSFYYNNVCGFLRHKTCSPFYFYSHLENRILNLIEIPTVIMDSTLFNYLSSSNEDVYTRSIELLEKVKKYNGAVCINWHNETMAPEYGWYAIYEEILRWLKKNSGSTYTMAEIYERLAS